MGSPPHRPHLLPRVSAPITAVWGFCPEPVRAARAACRPQQLSPARRAVQSIVHVSLLYTTGAPIGAKQRAASAGSAGGSRFCGRPGAGRGLPSAPSIPRSSTEFPSQRCVQPTPSALLHRDRNPGQEMRAVAPPDQKICPADFFVEKPDGKTSVQNVFRCLRILNIHNTNLGITYIRRQKQHGRH